MNNIEIAEIFSLLSKLMDIHDENSFRSKSYANAAFQLEKINTPLKEMPVEQIASQKGIGDSTAKKIGEILSTGKLKALTELQEKTPQGVMEMLHIKGLGPKKIRTVWKEMEIENIGELLYACNENRLTLYKGFGKKTQQNIKDTIQFYLRSQGSFLFAQLEAIEKNLLDQLQKIIAPSKIFSVGPVAMHDDTIDTIEFVSNGKIEYIKEELNKKIIEYNEDVDSVISFKIEEGIHIKITHVDENMLMQTVFEKNSSSDFMEIFRKKYSITDINQFSSEEDYFSSFQLPYIPAHLRQNAKVIEMAEQNKLSSIIQTSDIKGVIHSHSNWSDGSFSLEQMAMAAMKKGFEYLVISDHSKSAFYANGLQEERIKAQHQQIDELNNQLAPFKIFKSIESDILNDGSLDYNNHILSTFDLVIASVHSNLKMTEEKAMARLITAIENPYTTILGHLTGRLLLSRKGYPLDHKKIIAACVANGVVIELNANPRRLDIDWRWVQYAVENGALISINPDAHAIEGYDDIYYGVIAAQKGLLTAAHNLSSLSLYAFEQFLTARKRKKGLL